MKKRHKVFLLNFSLLIMALIFFLFCFETIVRVIHISSGYDFPKGMYQKDDILDFSLTPNFKGKLIKNEFETDIYTNSHGLRDIEYSNKKTDDFRILALGDSFTWGGYGCDLNETFIKILEKELNKNSHSFNYQVINTGVPGYGTDQEFLYLINKGYKFEPDLVILNFAVGNDFSDNLKSGENTVKNGIIVFEKVRLPNKIRSFLLMNFYSYRIVEKGLVGLFKGFIQKRIRGRFEDYASQVNLFLKSMPNSIETVKTIKLLDDMKKYLDSKNIKFAVVIIPLKYQVDDDLKSIFIKNNLQTETYIDMEMPQKIIKEWGVKNNITIIDLLPPLIESNRNKKLYWFANRHFNVEGNLIIGMYIYDSLINNGLIDPKGS